MNRYLLKAQRAMTNLRRADTRRDRRRAQYWKRQTFRYCILGLKIQSQKITHWHLPKAVSLTEQDKFEASL